jgi:OmpA-OmpF porin, OOP family
MCRTAVLMVMLSLSIYCVGVPTNQSAVTGTITSRSGDSLTVNSGGQVTTVVLTDETATKDDKGLFGLDKQYMSDVVLIPGLKVKVQGAPDEQGRFVAKTITVDGDDLETAEMIQSGMHPTAEQVAENVQAIAEHQQNLGAHAVQLAAHTENITANTNAIAAQQQQIQQNMKDIEENTDRFMALSDYDVKDQATLRFDVGSSKLSTKDQQQLKNLAQGATGLKGYIVEVTGYADATGSATMNTKLSENRAKAVVAYLFQQCGVPMRHMVAPGAMGEYGPAASNETKAGRAENRRAEVKLLVNKGISGS